MIGKFAIRNIQRNKKRSIISASSVFAGALFLGLAYGFVNGMVDFMMEGFIKYQTGHIRVTTEAFEEREKFFPVDEVIYDSARYVEKIKQIKHVDQVEETIRFGILLGKDDSTINAVGMATDLQTSHFKIPEKIIEGSLQESGLYLGMGLAEKLDIKIGEELLIAAKTSEGGLNGIKLPVAGIVRMGVGSLDERFFFLSMNDAKKLLKIREGTTEIYVYLKNADVVDEVHAEIAGFLDPGIKAATFKEQLGGLYSYIEAVKYIYGFIEMTILFLASFVIINTMIMAIFERMREIGTMKALGMNEKELFWLFTSEGALIGLLGGIPGALLGFFIVVGLGQTGVNFESMLGGIEFPVEYIIYPKIAWWHIFIVLGMATVVPTIAAMIPARYVRRYLPADALRM